MKELCQSAEDLGLCDIIEIFIAKHDAIDPLSDESFYTVLDKTLIAHIDKTLGPSPGLIR